MALYKLGFPINNKKSNELTELNKKIDDAFKTTNLQLELILSDKDKEENDEIKRKINNLKRIINNNYEELKNKLDQPPNGLLTILDHITNELEIISNKTTNTKTPTTRLQPVLGWINENKNILNENKNILNNLENKINSAFQSATLQSNQILNKVNNISIESDEIKNKLLSNFQSINLRLENLEEKSKKLQYISNILVIQINENLNISDKEIDCDFGEFEKCEIALIEFRTTENIGRGTIHLKIRNIRDSYYNNESKKYIYSFQHNGGRVRQKPATLIYVPMINTYSKLNTFRIAFRYDDGSEVNLRNCFLKLHVKKYVKINDENAYINDGLQQMGEKFF